MNIETKQKVKDFNSEFKNVYLFKINEIMNEVTDKLKEDLIESPLMSKEQKFEALRIEVDESIKTITKELTRVDEAIKSFENSKTRILSNEELDRLDADLNEYNVRIEQEPIVMSMEMDERTMKDILRISDYTLYCYYKVAYQLLMENNYTEASNILFYLTLLNPFVKDYWTGLGMSERVNGNIDSSLMAFAMAALMDENDPMPHLHSALCYIQIKDIVNAEIELNMGKTIAMNGQNFEKWQTVISRIENNLNTIKSFV